MEMEMECAGAGVDTGRGDEEVGLVDSDNTGTEAATGTAGPSDSIEEIDPLEIPPWNIDPNHGMHVGPGFLGDAPHSLRTREVFRYYHPAPSTGIVPPLNTGTDYIPHALSPTLVNSHDPILACLANLITRTLSAKRCIITLTGTGLSYVIAESTRSLSLHYPHTHSPGDQLFLGAGMATESIGGLCEHTISLLPPRIMDNDGDSEGDVPFLLEIPDLRRHPKYYRAGYVRGWPHGRFYCGAPLRTRSGVSIGTVCVMDDRVRPGGLSAEERVSMTGLAEVVMGYLETKREGEEGRARQAAEIELGRFIAEGFLEEEENGENFGAKDRAMVERRDGRLLSPRALEERARREAERRKRVEDRRAAFQERMFAGMVRREREREHRELEDSLRMRKEGGAGRKARKESVIAKLEMSEVTTTAVGADGRIIQGITEKEDVDVNVNVDVDVDVDMMEVDEGMKGDETNPDAAPLEPILIAHARTRKSQPGIIELCPSRMHFASSSPSPPPAFDDSNIDFGIGAPPESSSLSLLDTISFPSMPSTSAKPDGPTPPSSFSDPFTRSETASGTNFTSASTEPYAPESIRDESEIYMKNRRSNYEKSASVEASFRATFSRAAALIQNGISANVVFLDPDLEGFFTETNPTDGEHPTYVSSCVDSEVFARARRPRWLRQRTGALAYAISSGVGPSLPDRCGVNPAFDLAALDEVTLAEIVAENRTGGGIIAFGSGAYPGLDDDIPERTRTEEVLPKFLPGVRSAIIVPLVGGEHSSGTLSTAPGAVFAVAVVWTCDPTRTFSNDVEGRFVVAVGRGIVAEVGRMNVLNADKAKSEFISSISHELRTPLHGILASADFLSEGPLLDNTQRSFVDTIISCASTLLETVNHVLEFQKLNAAGPEGWEKLNAASAGSPGAIDTAKTPAAVVDPPLGFDTGTARMPSTRRNSMFFGAPSAPLVPAPPVDPNAPINLLPVDPTLGTSTLTTPTTAQMLANAAVSTRTTTDLSAVVQDVTEGVCLGYSFNRGIQAGANPSTHALANDFASLIYPPPSSLVNGEVSIIIDIPPGDWRFNTNRASMRRIINNLVGNALKYNRPGGWVRIALSTPDSPPDKASGKSKVVFTISDSGKGISREFLKTKLFTPFSQENPLSAGAGLGLSLVRQLVGVLGGRIDITSQVGVGTTVVVEMPVSASGRKEGEVMSGFDGGLKSRAQGRKIRFVGFESDTSTGTLCAHIAEGLQHLKQSLIGYAVGFYGMEVVDMPGTEDVLIAEDINSPGVSDTLKQRRVPVMALCTRPPIPGSKEEAEFTQKGPIAFLRKPFGPKKFTQGLCEAMNLLDQPRAAPPPAPPLPSSPQAATKEATPPPALPPAAAASTTPPPTGPTTVPPQQLPPPTIYAHLSPLCKKPDLTKPTILAVEDNHINMRLLTMYLVKARYPFSTAVDGLEALNLVKAQRECGGRGFDVILMDLQMPVLSGTESTREIRALEAQDAADRNCLRRSYIIALTGLAAAKDRQEAFVAGVDAYVVKPAKFLELEKMWMEFLAKETR